MFYFSQFAAYFPVPLLNAPSLEITIQKPVRSGSYHSFQGEFFNPNSCASMFCPTNQTHWIPMHACQHMYAVILFQI